MDQRPGFFRRIAALLIDYALILGWMALLGLATLIMFMITDDTMNWLAAGPVVAQLLGFVVLVLPVGIYLFAMEAGSRQATVGKRAMKLRVVRTGNLDRPSRARILVRTALKLLPWEFAHFLVWNIVALASTGETEFPPALLAGLIVADVLPIAYVVVVMFETLRRGPHDLVAGTRVIFADAAGSSVSRG